MLWESRAWAAPLPSQFCTGTTSFFYTLHSLVGKEPMACGGGQCYHRASAQRENHPAPEIWAVGAPAAGIQFQQQLYPYGLTWRLHCPQWSSLLSCRPVEQHLGFQQRAASPWQKGDRSSLA